MDATGVADAVERARGGDRGGLSELYQTFGQRVLGLCRHLLGSPEAAEDARSEVFLRLPRGIDRYDPALPFERWLLSVTSHHCLDVLLVGLPLALVLLGVYPVGVYAVKIVVGLALGRALLRPRGNARRDALRALVVGLALLTVATALPLVGGPIWVVVAGALAWRLAQMAGIVRSSAA